MNHTPPYVIRFSICYIGGVFISAFKQTEKADVMFIANAAKAWTLTAVPLLLICAFIVSTYSVGSDKLAYISSAISFISAAFAGKSAAANRKGGTFASGLTTACFVVVLLLSMGFAIDSKAISVSGIISVVSFTFSGCLFGSVVLSELFKAGRKRRVRIKK